MRSVIPAIILPIIEKTKKPKENKHKMRLDRSYILYAFADL